MPITSIYEQTSASTADPVDENRTVLLFFESTERDKLVRGDRFLRRKFKDIVRELLRSRRVFGVDTSFRKLVHALTLCGYDVRVNDYAAAKSVPHHPVGIAGWPQIVENWQLPNPYILGPGPFSHPKEAPRLVEDPRFRKYLIRTQWMRDLFEPFYGERCVWWYAGVDTDLWRDTAHLEKDVDFLIYDKIRWNRVDLEGILLKPIREILKKRGLSHAHLRYGRYEQAKYHSLLARSRAMIFLCEHENQGGAVLEAMACNVPVLAWDPGMWLDPQRFRYVPNIIPASSVQSYFNDRCGECFTSLEDFPAALERLLERSKNYAPRDYVIQNLGFEASGRLYAEAYFALARGDGAEFPTQPPPPRRC